MFIKVHCYYYMFGRLIVSFSINVVYFHYHYVKKEGGYVQKGIEDNVIFSVALNHCVFLHLWKRPVAL